MELTNRKPMVFNYNDYLELQAKNAELERQLAESRRETQAAVEDSTDRKNVELTPIYTCGGHGGYYDDDDEDFWCPICHAHLGTHTGYQPVCPRCGQRINPDSEPLHNYQDMRAREAEWREPQNGRKGQSHGTEII